MPPRTRRTSRAERAPARPTAITDLSSTSRFYKWMIMGDSGVGKTVLAGTAPDNVLLEFDPEGHESAQVHGSTSKLWRIPDWATWNEALDYFKRGTGCQDFNWVTIDTISEGEDVCWWDHLEQMKLKKPTTRSLYKPTLDDYPQVWNKVKRVVEEFNRLPINVLYTAHVMALPQWDEDREEDYELRLPLIGSTKNGIMSRKMCAKVSLVGYLDVKRHRVEDEEGEQKIEEFRRLIVTKRRDLVAKNRYGWTAPIDEPTMPEMIAAADAARLQAHDSAPPRTRRARRSA